MEEQPNIHDGHKRRRRYLTYTVGGLLVLQLISGVGLLVWNVISEAERKKKALEHWDNLKRKLSEPVGVMPESARTILAELNTFSGELRKLHIKREQIVTDEEFKAAIEPCVQECFRQSFMFFTFPPEDMGLDVLQGILAHGGCSLADFVPKETRVKHVKSVSGAAVRFFLTSSPGEALGVESHAMHFHENGEPYLGSSTGASILRNIDALLTYTELTSADIGLPEKELKEKSAEIVSAGWKAIMKDTEAGRFASSHEAGPLMALEYLVNRGGLDRNKLVPQGEYVPFLRKVIKGALSMAEQHAKDQEHWRALQELKVAGVLIRDSHCSLDDVGVEMDRIRTLLERLNIPDARKQETLKLFEECAERPSALPAKESAKPAEKVGLIQNIMNLRVRDIAWHGTGASLLAMAANYFVPQPSQAERELLMPRGDIPTDDIIKKSLKCIGDKQIKDLLKLLPYEAIPRILWLLLQMKVY